MTVPVHGLPSVVRPGLEVALVPPALRGNRWHTITSVSSDNRAGSLVSLSGVSALGDAEGLVGSYLLARAEDLPADLPLHDRERLIGRVARDEETGRAGVIEEVMTGPANDVWVIRDAGSEVLVPVINEVVSAVPESGEIPIRIPRGLEWQGGVARS
ncbi:ribosome maturation factor RimM [Thermophilibacter provencensis]|uniref:16S rRNA-processing protein n=1 Tax=Thermophilibacter provencensis TaxID=1852386 RepID=A0ABT7V2Y2_9ACTN|nr:16S rRNA-processing protein [Thermophilibacter provencensis]MDM8270938.1 16S rRNA-processing protein [Thermophilibacter provencensis]